MLIIIQI